MVKAERESKESKHILPYAVTEIDLAKVLFTEVIKF